MPAPAKQVNINVIIKEELGQSFSNQLLTWILIYGRYIIVITQIIVLSVFFLRFKIDRDHTDLKEAVSQKQALFDSIATLEVEVRQVQGRLTNIRNISANQDALLEVLRFLQKYTPTDTIFSSLTLTQEKISFTATAGSLRSFSFFLNELQQDNRFSEVTLEDISRRTDGRIEFTIEAKINLKEFI